MVYGVFASKAVRFKAMPACQQGGPRDISVYGVNASKAVRVAAGDVINHCEVRQAFEKGPHPPTAGTYEAAAFNKGIQNDVAALRALGPPPIFPFLGRAQSLS